MMWRPGSVEVSVLPYQVRVTSQGRTDSLVARLDVTIMPDGRIITSYEFTDSPAQRQEVGVAFRLPPSLDLLRWERNALWSSYPAGHIGRPQGEASKYAQHAESEAARRAPGRPWELDTKDFYLFPSRNGEQMSGLPVPNDFRSRKESILRYTLLNGVTGNGIEVRAPGTVAARTAVRTDGMLDLFIANEWTYLSLNWGNYERPTPTNRPYGNGVTMHLLGK
jgi:hypothetical protein